MNEENNSDKNAGSAAPEPHVIRLKPPSAPPPLPRADNNIAGRILKSPEASDTPPRVEGNIVGLLLKSPHSAVLTIMDSKNLATESAKMLAAAALCYAAFGLAVGFFGGAQVALTAVWKAPLIAICSMLLCFPSLFVFTAVSGSPLTLGRAFALGSACLAMTGLILVGLAPVAWLFAVSTKSLGFVVVMAFIIWLVSLPFVTKFLRHSSETGLLQRSEGLNVWFIIFVVVTLQMTTVMRPILTAPEKDQSVISSGKMFFMQHFTESFDVK